MEIENYREGPQNDKDKSIATFDVTYKGSRYIDLRLMVSQKGHHFISYPSRMRTDKDGKPIYLRLYDWGKDRNEEFDKLVLEAVKPFREKSSHTVGF